VLHAGPAPRHSALEGLALFTPFAASVTNAAPTAVITPSDGMDGNPMMTHADWMGAPPRRCCGSGGRSDASEFVLINKKGSTHFGQCLKKKTPIVRFVWSRFKCKNMIYITDCHTAELHAG